MPSLLADYTHPVPWRLVTLGVVALAVMLAGVVFRLQAPFLMGAAVLIVHGSFLHVGLNMLVLWMMGRSLEPLLGRWRFVALYLVSGLGGSVAVTLLAPGDTVVGASGAIFGMLGALLLLAKRFGGNYQMIAGFLALNIVITIMGGGYISWQAHLGGLIGGLASAAALILPPRERRPAGQLIGLLALTVVTLAAIVWRAIMLA